MLVVQDEEWRTVTAAHILIAVGTVPAPPPGAQADGEVILTSDDVVQLKKLPRTFTVVGAGVIGIEYASMFAALDIKVILVEKRLRPLEFLDAEIVEELIHQMRNRNVTFRFGETVEHLEFSDTLPRRAVIGLESGKRIVSDAVMFSAGRLGATDEHFQTSVPHIFAAGDVIGYPSLAATSSEQGRRVAAYAFG